MTATATVDPAEIAKFEAMAADWWAPEGKFRPLHAMNPCRIGYIADQAAMEFGRDRKARRPFEGLALADIGCGGGIAAEPLARLGFAVTGLDAAAESLGVARAHAEAMGLIIDYRSEAAEAVAAKGEAFDVVTALEIVEHVADVPAFCAALAALVKPGGALFMSTLNRTGKSWATAIVGAERILRWLPPGTHDWAKFPTPDELEAALTEAGLEVVDFCGMKPDIARDEWRTDAGDLSVNYLAMAVKPAG